MATSKNTPNLSRRSTLAMGVTGLAAGTLQSLTLAEAALSGPDVDLVRLYRELQELERLGEAARHVLIERADEAEHRFPPVPEPFKGWVGSLDKFSCSHIDYQIEQRAKKPGYSPEHIKALRRCYNAYRPTFYAVWEETGAAAAEDAHQAAQDRIGKMQARILMIPAKGPQGVLVKLLVWHAATNAMNRTDWDASFVMSSILDLDRLTGGAIELPSDVRQEAITV